MAKRYYWLKLKDDFFTDKRIKKLRRIAGGDTYTIIYLKMMMKCMNNDGILEYEGIEDNFADELALDLDEDADNVQVTVNFLMRAGLLEEMGENRFLMAEVPELIGSETASAQRVRDFRNKQKTLQCNTDVTEVKQLCSVEKEIDKDKDIEKDKDKDIEKDTDKDKDKRKKEKIKHTYGVYKHVRLTDDDYKRLCDEYGDIKTGECITFLDEYIEMKPKYKANNHYLCIRKWVADAVEEHRQRHQNRTNSSGSAYIDAINNRMQVVDDWLKEYGNND
jgi:predicted phage replisome organizer